MDTFKAWMLEYVLPLWSKAGVDTYQGGFFESLNWQGKPELSARRALVQSRQIFSFRTAFELKAFNLQQTSTIVESGVRYLIENYSLPSYAFIHSVDVNGKPAHKVPELYTQAFALFGMANAYAVLKKPEIKNRAKALLQYLNKERKLPNGGFSELIHGQVAYEANPHMHLFEAAIYWMEVDPDPQWKELADSILELALTRFIDTKTGFLAEHFDADWKPLLENGHFVWEPGHLYEWAWLMGRYEKITGRDLLVVRERLFAASERYGLHNSRGAVMDELWSHGQPKLVSSRFWPQCERIKAAMQFVKDGRVKDKGAYQHAADQAVEVLMRYFNTAKPGLWHDTWNEAGEFTASSAKASSLYHIIGAYSEYYN